jgi:hypothetical protein
MRRIARLRAESAPPSSRLCSVCRSGQNLRQRGHHHHRHRQRGARRHAGTAPAFSIARPSQAADACCPPVRRRSAQATRWPRSNRSPHQTQSYCATGARSPLTGWLRTAAVFRIVLMDRLGSTAPNWFRATSSFSQRATRCAHARRRTSHAGTPWQIPADCRIIEAQDCRVSEMALTGEHRLPKLFCASRRQRAPCRRVHARGEDARTARRRPRPPRFPPRQGVLEPLARAIVTV